MKGSVSTSRVALARAVMDLSGGSIDYVGKRKRHRDDRCPDRDRFRWVIAYFVLLWRGAGAVRYANR